jgi:hypothetical protein
VYTAGVIAAVLYFAGSHDPDMGKATGFLVHTGIISSGPVALTGFLDWKTLPKHSPAWRTGLIHMIITGLATGLFVIAFQGKHETYYKGIITNSDFALILVAYALMAVGGWLGGKLVFVFGSRVLAAEGSPGQP